MSALPGAADLVRALDAAGHQVALASSGDPEFAQEAVAMLGIGDEVATLTTSGDVDSSKPDPDLVSLTLDRLDGVTDSVFVGDTPYDVEAARRAGLGCIGLLSGGYSRAELLDAGAILVVALPTDLLGLDWPSHLGPVEPR